MPTPCSCGRKLMECPCPGFCADEKRDAEIARESRHSVIGELDADGWPARWSDPTYLGDGPWGA